jgi:hypothetical protein
LQVSLTAQQGINARGQQRPVGLDNVKVTAQIEQGGLFDHAANTHTFNQSIGVIDLFGLLAVGDGASDEHAAMIDGKTRIKPYK